MPIGPGIRDRRRRLGLTLKELALASGLSAPFLSQIERDLASPSLVSLAAIARALGVSMSYFVGAPASSQIVRRAAAPEHLTLDGGRVVYTRLSGRHEERKLEALLIEVPPSEQSPPTRRDGEGFWYILDGDIEMWVGDESFILRPGDSAHFDQRHSYHMRNASATIARIIWVGTPSLL